MTRENIEEAMHFVDPRDIENPPDKQRQSEMTQRSPANLNDATILSQEEKSPDLNIPGALSQTTSNDKEFLSQNSREAKAPSDDGSLPIQPESREAELLRDNFKRIVSNGIDGSLNPEKTSRVSAVGATTHKFLANELRDTGSVSSLPGKKVPFFKRPTNDRNSNHDSDNDSDERRRPGDRGKGKGNSGGYGDGPEQRKVLLEAWGDPDYPTIRGLPVIVQLHQTHPAIQIPFEYALLKDPDYASDNGLSNYLAVGSTISNFQNRKSACGDLLKVFRSYETGDYYLASFTAMQNVLLTTQYEKICQLCNLLVSLNDTFRLVIEAERHQYNGLKYTAFVLVIANSVIGHFNDLPLPKPSWADNF